MLTAVYPSKSEDSAHLRQTKTRPGTDLMIRTDCTVRSQLLYQSDIVMTGKKWAELEDCWDWCRKLPVPPHLNCYLLKVQQGPRIFDEVETGPQSVLDLVVYSTVLILSLYQCFSVE